MRIRTLTLAALPVAFALAGCGPTTTTGGTQTKTSDAKGNEVKVDESLKINAPVGSPYGLKQGETKTYDFSLSKGKDLKDDVEVTADKADKLTVEVNPKTVPASGDGKFTVTVKVADDAAVAEHTVRLTAKSGKGNPATADLKFKVDKK